MFGRRKIRCNNCNKEVSGKFDYCPFCASALKDLKKEYGMLGRTDDLGANEVNKMFNETFSGSIFNKMFSSAVKMINNELRKTNESQIRAREPAKENAKQKANFEIYINGKKINLPGNIEGVQIEEAPFSADMGIRRPKQPKAKIPRPKISEETLQKSSKLPRKEAKSHVSRTSDRVIYELETPGLNSLNNVLVNQLEDSLEVRAYTEKAVYFKTLTGKLPLMQYSISPSEGKLILEFKA